MGMKAFALVIFGVSALNGSTCHQQSNGEVTKDKPVAEVNLEGVDTSPLTSRERREFDKYVSELLSPCTNVPVPIAQCITEKRPCSRCLPAAKFVLKGVRDGMSRDQIDKAYKNRFDPDKIVNVPLDGSPTIGPEGAPITIVEFADFECPHCGQVAPLLDKLVVEERKGDIRFAFKFYPLASHPHAEPAARAAVAAMRQGKFWEMHHLLFQNQKHLEQTDIESYAKDLGLDLPRFKADMQSKETLERIARDKKLGEDLKIGGTPAIYINGRSYDGHQDMKEWIDLELAGMGRTPGAAAPAPSASASGSAAPRASGSAPAASASGRPTVAPSGAKSAPKEPGKK